MSNPGINGLSAYWSMDENSGVRNCKITDINKLSPGNNIPGNEAGKRGGAAWFTSDSSHYLVLGNTPAIKMSSTNFSFGLWAYFFTPSGQGDVVMGIYEDSGNREYQIELLPTGIRFEVRLSSNQYNVDYTEVIEHETWYFICCSYDSAAGEISIGVNDVWNTNSSVPSGGITPTTDPLYFGRNKTGHYIDGLIDEAFIYNDRLLTSAEFKWLYNSGTGRVFSDIFSPVGSLQNPGLNSLSAWWKLDETSGSRADSHNSNNLVDTNGVGNYSTGKQGRCGDWVASSHEYLNISVNSNTQLNMEESSFTVGLWINPHNISIQNRLLDQWHLTGDKQWFLHLNGSKAHFYVYDGATAHYVTANNYGTLSNGAWYFICCYFDITTGIMGIGINDVWDTAQGPTTIPDTSPGNLFVGVRQGGDYDYDGYMDEIFIYKGRVLTGPERTYMYNEGHGRTYEHLLQSVHPGSIGLSSYWDMNEVSGTRVCKLFSGSNLTDYFTVGSVIGKRGRAANLISGNTEYLMTGDSTVLSMGGQDFTLCVWVKPHAVATSSRIISKWTNGGDREYTITTSGSKVYFYVYDGSSQYYVTANSYGTLTNGEWYFICCRYNYNGDKTISIAVNDIWDVASGPTTVADYGNDLYFGSRQGAEYFDGYIDEAFFWRGRYLAKEECKWLYNEGYGRVYLDIISDPPPTVSIDTSMPIRNVPIMVLNTSLEVVGIIEDYYSLVWAERYNEFGDFELELPISYTESSFVRFGYFLYIKRSDKIMVIEEMQPEITEEKSSLVIEGRSAESLLDRRILEEPKDIHGPAELSIYTLMDENITNPTNSNRKINIFNGEWPGMIIDLFFEDQFKMQSVYDAVVTICKALDLGFKVVMYLDELWFYVYRGIDRSYKQSENPWVVFSENFDNVLDGSFYSSEKNRKNLVIVTTNDSVEELQSTHVWSEDVEPSDLDRLETSISISVNRNLSSPALSDSDVLSVIYQQGRDKITSLTPVGIMDGDFDVQGSFKFGDDFFMGDIVQCVVAGNGVSGRVIELVRSYSSEGWKTYVAMDYQVRPD
jgi:predicted nucleic acid-binding Zn finger protein